MLWNEDVFNHTEAERSHIELEGLIVIAHYQCHQTDRLLYRHLGAVGAGKWDAGLRGRGFVRRAASHPVLATDSCFVPALQLFIAEEQEHSGILGRFLDREGIPRLTNHWLDEIFRRLRKLAGLEACATVLVTAEVLAIPFYQALRDATGSPLLRAICVRILCDEAAHLNYQALTLGLVRRPLLKELDRSARFATRRCSRRQQFCYGNSIAVYFAPQGGISGASGTMRAARSRTCSSEFARSRWMGFAPNRWMSCGWISSLWRNPLPHGRGSLLIPQSRAHKGWCFAPCHGLLI